MYYYEILTWDYVFDCGGMLSHEKHFSESEFNSMCAKSFAKIYSLRREYFKDEILSEKYISNEKDAELLHQHVEYGDLLEYVLDYMITTYGFKKIVLTEAFTINFKQSPSEEYDNYDDGTETTNHNLIKSSYESNRFILIEKKGYFI